MRLFKRVLSLVIAAAMAAGLASCSASPSSVTSDTSQTGATEKLLESTGHETSGSSAKESISRFGKAVVVYFSCTGNTKDVANKIASAANCKTYEIVPSKPYSTEDLNYKNRKSRASKEQNDASSRPEISVDIAGWESYDTVFIGYPVWFGKAPKILYTFVESHDFQGKKVIPFCTSESSDIGSSATDLASLAKDSGKWINGTRFSATVKAKDITEWLTALVEAGEI